MSVCVTTRSVKKYSPFLIVFILYREESIETMIALGRSSVVSSKQPGRKVW